MLEASQDFVGRLNHAGRVGVGPRLPHNDGCLSIEGTADEIGIIGRPRQAHHIQIMTTTEENPVPGCRCRTIGSRRSVNTDATIVTRRSEPFAGTGETDTQDILPNKIFI